MLQPITHRLSNIRILNDPTLVPLRDISSASWNASYLSRGEARFTVEACVAPRIIPHISTRSFVNAASNATWDPVVNPVLYGLSPSIIDDPKSLLRLRSIVPNLPAEGLLRASPTSQSPPSPIQVPPIKRLIVDSAKLSRLDELLRELKDGGHRVLLYFQMTKMMDLVEEYLIYRQYKYLRLDGSSPIGERRDMVTSWQTKSALLLLP
jgi:DNA helicase INO80